MKLTISQKGNEDQRLPHVLQIFIGHRVITMNDIPKYVSLFREENEIYFELSSDNQEAIQSDLSTLNVIYSIQ